MQEVAQQLEQVRRRGRALLVLQRLAQAAAVAVPVLLTLGLVDFGLRLPGWLRAVIGLVLLGFGLTWLVRRLARAWRFGPTVSELALRVERLYPRMAGRLTSALDFALHPQKYARPATTAALAEHSVAEAQKELAGVRVARLINLRPTRKRAAFFLGSAVLLLLVVLAVPTHSAIAASRWFMPWGDTAWPKRTQLTATPTDAVRPVDSPVEFTAAVQRGFRPGMRVWLNTRWRDGGDAGPVSSVLMTEQVALTAAPSGVDPPESAAAEPDESAVKISGGGGGVFKLQWRPPADVVRQVSSGRRASASLEYWFSAGDDRTEAQPLTLVARPALLELVAEVQPPDYAAGLVAAQRLGLHEQSERIASLPALKGSRVTLTLQLNKPMPDAALTPRVLVPGLVSESIEVSLPAPDRVVLGFTVGDDRQTRVVLTDEHGLADTDERVYRFEATRDRPPTVTIVEPTADASVLATAVLPVAARADDDVGVRRLRLDVEHPARDESLSEATLKTTLLAERDARQRRLTADAVLDLATLDVRVGDVVVVQAHGTDVFDLHGMRHDPVDATPRRLRIIDPATLIAQVRGDLAGVRQQAVRLERQQDELARRAEDAPAPRAAEQTRLSRGIDTQARQLQNITERLELNRLDEPALDELVRQAAQLVDEAQRTSEQAQQNLRDAAQSAAEAENNPTATAEAQASEAQAETQQEAVRQTLDELARLLDQGQDALGLKLELARLRTEQEALSQDTREMLPRTVGQSAEDLSPEVREALRELAERQAALGEQAQAAVERLQSTAESLAQQGESDQDRAAAQALAEAAAVAQRQGLNQQMQQSEQGLQENQLSQAGNAQLQSLDTLDQMMEQLGDQDKLRQELLKRRLLQLAEKLERLIEGQTVALGALEDAADAGLPGLAEAQSRLWVRTIAVQTEAEADEATAAVAPIVGQAVDAQAGALAALRGTNRADATAGERVALERLEEALEKVRELQAEAEEDQTRQQRQELRKQYLALAERQGVLRGEVEALLDESPLSRRARAKLRGLGARQGEIKDEAAALGETVSDTVVFRRTHELIDAAAGAARGSMNRGDDDGRALPTQRKVVVLLEAMAAALDEGGKPSEFAQESGSGEGGGGGGEPPLVPPAAELKLLRGMQQAVYDETRSLHDAARGRPDAAQSERLDGLAREQRELSETGRRLIESMSRNQPQVLNETLPDAVTPEPEESR